MEISFILKIKVVFLELILFIVRGLRTYVRTYVQNRTNVLYVRFVHTEEMDNFMGNLVDT